MKRLPTRIFSAIALFTLLSSAIAAPAAHPSCVNARFGQAVPIHYDVEVKNTFGFLVRSDSKFEMLTTLATAAQTRQLKTSGSDQLGITLNLLPAEEICKGRDFFTRVTFDSADILPGTFGTVAKGSFINLVPMKLDVPTKLKVVVDPSMDFDYELTLTPRADIDAN